MHAEQQLFNAHEVSRITGRSLASVWRDARAGRLEKVRIGGSTKFTRRSVERLCQPPSSSAAE